MLFNLFRRMEALITFTLIVSVACSAAAAFQQNSGMIVVIGNVRQCETMKSVVCWYLLVLDLTSIDAVYKTLNESEYPYHTRRILFCQMCRFDLQL